MLKAEWLACTDPEVMLDLLRGKVSDRKLRLFAVACCRRIWTRMTDEYSRRAVEVAERFADGGASRQELRAANAGAQEACKSAAYLFPYSARTVSCCRAAYHAVATAEMAVRYAARCAAEATGNSSAERGEQAALLHCIGGNPFRPVPGPNAAWLSWAAGTVRKLAEAIYDGRRFGDLPILADALEDAGCDNADVLAHCRGGGEHARGCWVVDWVMGWA